ncbi:hypothetical protein B0H67DRAFT_648151 [Lasiosphaeris hirsuta]|uniref:Uncharacterized protein n=1 Tax=Lasiosphaeris hirsuta TaxID=260670 RepID=A0AA40A2C9_9PEZI|nr:hypothetical protein B0H67DRAFT_648151 [Lasiosphaeris hirsuta]
MARIQFLLAVFASTALPTSASPAPAASSKPVGYEISRDYMCFATECYINCAYAACLYVTVKTEDGKTSRLKIPDYSWDTQAAATPLGQSGWQFLSTGTGESRVAAAVSNDSAQAGGGGISCVKDALKAKREVYLGTDKMYWRCQWPF